MIENPNSSGQGYCPEHQTNEAHPVILSYGYQYSHTTPVTLSGGAKVEHHSYYRGDHWVSYHQEPGGSLAWSTSCSLGSGRQHHWHGVVALSLHLKRKRGRYPVLR